MAKYNSLAITESLSTRVIDDENGRRVYHEIAVWEDAASKAKDRSRRPDRVEIRPGIFADGANSFLISYQPNGVRIKEFLGSPNRSWKRTDTGELVRIPDAITLDPQPQWETETFVRDLDAEAVECFDRWRARAITRDYLAAKPDRRGTTLNLQVGAGADDAYGRKDGASFNGTGTILYCWSQTADGARYGLGSRFQNVTIENGATIDAADFMVNVIDTSQDDFESELYFDDVDSSVNFVTSATVFGRTLTTAKTTYTVTAAGAGWETISGISAVQEVVDRAGWASGGAMTALLLGRLVALRQVAVKSYESSTSLAPKLDIDYTLPVTSGRAKGCMLGVG